MRLFASSLVYKYKLDAKQQRVKNIINIMAIWYLQLLLVLSISGAKAAVLTIENNCRETIWPGIQSGGGHPILVNGGFTLPPREIVRFNTTRGWSGRIWGRRGCSFDQYSRNGNCASGDCGGLLECNGAGGETPATLVEITLDSPIDYYDISLVDGYNLPISIIPSGNCQSVACNSDLNLNCPAALQVVRNGFVVACKSACVAFGTPRYCCSGAYNSPSVCPASSYSRFFKASCPLAYSYAFDDHTSLFTCRDASYTIRFC